METPDDAETKLPSDLPAYPSITFSSGDSWRQVAEEYGKIVDKQITGADLKSLVGKLIAGKFLVMRKQPRFSHTWTGKSAIPESSLANLPWFRIPQ